MDARDQQRIEVLGRWREGSLTVAEAALLLGSSERTAWRLRRRFGTMGVDGIVHGNRGRPSPRRLSEGQRDRIAELARTCYRGVNDSHLAELLAEDEGVVIGRSSLQRLLRRSGIGTTRTRRAPRYRSRRERMPQAGLLVQIDGSPHAWLEDRGPRLTLVGAIDDATGAIVAATFREAEDSLAYLTILARMCRAHGVPAAVYRDRSGIFAPTHRGGPLGDAGTQVGRAFAELGIASIAAASAQAKGRIERLWGTCQDRLVSELRLAGADDLAGANAVLERFVGRLHANFAVPAHQDHCLVTTNPAAVGFRVDGRDPAPDGPIRFMKDLAGDQPGADAHGRGVVFGRRPGSGRRFADPARAQAGHRGIGLGPVRVGQGGAVGVGLALGGRDPLGDS